MTAPDPDLAIAQLLQRDGRASFADLARAAGISTNAATVRMNRMLENGELHVVTLRGTLPGSHRLMAHVSVDASGPVLPLGLTLSRRSTITFASLTVGRFPIVLEVRAPTMEDLRAEIDRIRHTTGVRHVDVALGDVVVRDAYFRRASTRAVELDETDARLIDLLTQEPRAGYTALAERCGLSTSATRARVLWLLRQGVVHVTALIPHARLQGLTRVGVGINVNGPSVRASAEEIAGLDQVVFTMTATGRYDIVIGIDAAGEDAALRTIDTIRRLQGVVTTETWRHMHILRESYEQRPA